MKNKDSNKSFLKFNRAMYIICLILGVIFVRFQNILTEKKEEKYHLVRKEDKFNGRVYDIYLNKQTFINLDEIIFIEFYSMKNERYNPKYFKDFVQYNDSLVKHSNSDTIYLYRNNKEYYFILNDLHKTLPEN